MKFRHILGLIPLLLVSGITMFTAVLINVNARALGFNELGAWLVPCSLTGCVIGTIYGYLRAIGID